MNQRVTRTIAWFRDRLELAGVAIAAAAALWTIVTAIRAGTDPWPVLAVIGIAATSFAVASRLTTFSPWIVPATVLAAGAFVAVALVMRPRDPFGYENATGAFFALVAIAGLFLATSVATWPSRALAAVTAAAAASVPVLVGVASATALVVLLPTGGLIVLRGFGRRTAIASFVALFGVLLAATVLVGARSQDPARTTAIDRLVDRTLSERRAQLWHDALKLLSDHPLTGVGPGRFAVDSPTARADRDARWAHNEFLQASAEAGIPGIALAVAAFAWLIAAPSAGADDRSAVLGSAAAALLGMGSCIDYLLHFPGLVATASALAGAGACKVIRIRNEVSEEAA
jgi:O-antigen ligase